MSGWPPRRPVAHAVDARLDVSTPCPACVGMYKQLLPAAPGRVHGAQVMLAGDRCLRLLALVAHHGEGDGEDVHLEDVEHQEQHRQRKARWPFGQIKAPGGSG